MLSYPRRRQPHFTPLHKRAFRAARVAALFVSISMNRPPAGAGPYPMEMEMCAYV